MLLAIDINDVIRDNMFQFRRIYQKFIDYDFEIDLKDINSFNMMEVYPFRSKTELNKFKYVDYSYELFGRANCCDDNLPYVVNNWIEKTLSNLDEEYIPNVIFFSPFEMGTSIPSTYSFLSSKGFRTRGILFPKVSQTIFDISDIVITAQPSLIDNCPNNKIVIKINKPYNVSCETKYAFDSIVDLIKDPNELVIKLLENKIQ